MGRTIQVAQETLFGSSLSFTEGGRPAGLITFHGLVNRSADLGLDSQRLTFTTSGLLGRTVQATGADGLVVGTFSRTGLSHGGEVYLSGRHYRLKFSGMFSPNVSWSDASGIPVVSMKMGGMVRTNGTLEVADAVAPEDVPALVGLALLMWRTSKSDSGGGAAAAV